MRGTQVKEGQEDLRAVGVVGGGAGASTGSSAGSCSSSGAWSSSEGGMRTWYLLGRICLLQTRHQVASKEISIADGH